MAEPLIEKEIAKNFGRKLRSARLGAKMTQERLGQLSSVDRSHVGRLEAGDRVPRLDILVRLAGALDIDPCDLMVEVRWIPPSASGGRYEQSQHD